MHCQILKNQKGGVAIIMLLMMLSAILLITLTMSDILINGLRMDKTQLESTKAYFAAESGAERILHEIRKNDFNLSACSDGEYVDFTSGPCSGGNDCCDTTLVGHVLSNSASYTISYFFDTPTTTFSCIGGFGEVERKVEISY